MTILIEGVPVVACARCENMVPCTQQPEAGLPDDGLRVLLRGWYGGFHDFAFSDDDDPMFLLCHDCSVWLYAQFPFIERRTGLHPGNADNWCCPHAWDHRNGELVLP